jgi:hypothetical protein
MITITRIADIIGAIIATTTMTTIDTSRRPGGIVRRACRCSRSS